MAKPNTMFGFEIDGQVRVFPTLAKAALEKAEAAKTGQQVGELEELVITKA